MDDELIKMCDTPEIQDRWEPKAGDRVAYKNEKEDCSTSFLTPCEIMGILRHERVRSLLIYIPHIEDVLEWLGDRLLSISMITHVPMWDVACVGAKDLLSDKSILKALLKAYMHLEHNNAWNGKTWDGEL